MLEGLGGIESKSVLYVWSRYIVSIYEIFKKTNFTCKELNSELKSRPSSVSFVFFMLLNFPPERIPQVSSKGKFICQIPREKGFQGSLLNTTEVKIYYKAIYNYTASVQSYPNPALIF